MGRLIFTISRWLLGVTLIGLLIWNPFFLTELLDQLFPKTAEEGSMGGGYGLNHYLIAAVVAIGAVVCLKDLLVEWVSYPIRNFFSNIFYPNESVVPPPNYNVANLYRDQDRLDEAVEVYLGILKHHPGEVLAYVEGIKTAFDADQPEAAEKIAGMAVRLPTPEIQQHVAQVYEEARSEYTLRPRGDEAAATEEAQEE